MNSTRLSEWRSDYFVRCICEGGGGRWQYCVPALLAWLFGGAQTAFDGILPDDDSGKNGTCREGSAGCGRFSRLGIWLFWHMGRKMADFFGYFTSECSDRCCFAGTGPRFQQLWGKSFFQSDGICAEYRCRIYRSSGISGGCLSSVDDFYAVEK